MRRGRAGRPLLQQRFELRPWSRALCRVRRGTLPAFISRAAPPCAGGPHVSATIGGDLNALIAALDPDVVLTTDGGGGEVSATRRPVRGLDKVVRFLHGVVRQLKPTERFELIRVDGAPGIGVFAGEQLTGVVAFTVQGGLVSRIDMIRAPSKLARTARPPSWPATATGTSKTTETSRHQGTV